MNVRNRKTRAAFFSVVSNSTLVALKLMVGLVIGSVSVISEAIHSGVDLLAAVIALFAVKASNKPADKEHPFGHGKIENISGAIEALLIFVAATWIIYEAVKKLIGAAHVEDVSWGVAVMLVSAFVNVIVSKMLFRVGKETDSMALQADGWHLRTDVWTSAGVMCALAFIWLGGWLFPTVNLDWIDPAAAVIVAILIIRAAYRLTIESARDLLDSSLTSDEDEWIRGHIAAQAPKVRGFHHLRTRKSGATRFVEFHLLIPSDASVEESHCISHVVSAGIKEHLPGTVVTIHVEPCNGFCSSQCASGCLLNEDERLVVRAEAQRRLRF